MSSVHMAWVNVVTGRLGNGIRYSPAIYANFPWLDFTDQQKEELNKTGQAILDARKLYPDDSLAVLYEPFGMPPELLKAHKANNKLVLKLYDLPTNATESDIITCLFKMYDQATNK